jgi:hypothetical protein
MAVTSMDVAKHGSGCPGFSMKRLAIMTRC